MGGSAGGGDAPQPQGGMDAVLRWALLSPGSYLLLLVGTQCSAECTFEIQTGWQARPHPAAALPAETAADGVDLVSLLTPLLPNHEPGRLWRQDLRASTWCSLAAQTTQVQLACS